MRPKIKTGEMRLKKRASILTSFTLLLMFFFCTAQAATTVTAEVDRDEMEPEDTLTYTITVRSEERVEASLKLPDLQNWEVLKQWQNATTSSGMRMTDDGPEYVLNVVQTLSMTLQPKAGKTGRVAIGPAQADIAGRRYSTKSIIINVERGASQRAPQPNANRGQGQNQGRNRGRPQFPGGIMPPPGFPNMDDLENEDDLFSQLLKQHGQLGQAPGGFRTQPINPNEAFFVQVELDKTSAYQDEQVTASWYLYTRTMAIRDFDALKYPSLSGFWKEDIEIATALNWREEIINGVPYRKALLATFALFPIKSGISVVDEYKVRLGVADEMDLFGRGGTFRRYTKSSQPVKITVKPLPTEGRPLDFSGAVGQFQVSARVEDPNVVEGQPFALKIRLDGRGNPKRIDLPEIQFPEGLELYETQSEAKFFPTGNGFREFNLLIVPRKIGDLQIPGISISYFDPNQGKYVRTVTQPIPIRATRGTGSGVDNKRLGDNKAPLKSTEPTIAVDYNVGHEMTAKQEVIGTSTGLLAVMLILLWRARVELGWGQRKRDLNRRLQARFRKINERLSKSDWRGVGVEVTNTVYFVLGEVSGQGGANMELDKLLLAAPPSVRRELGEPVKKLMETFQAISFAPEEVSQSLRQPDEVKKLLTEMKAVLEKAVSLGLSAEQDGEFEKGPRAS